MTSSPDDQLASMIANLPDKTGRSLDAWIAHLDKGGIDAHKEIMAHLKGEHGVTHGYANLISQLARKAADGGADDDPVAAQYAGGKADLRPIYDALVKAVRGFGSDVELAPKKAYVSLRRSKQFGLIQPSTATRVDVGIKLRDRAPEGRLEAAGSWNSMVTHRVRVTGRDEVDAELVGWLREAYEEG
jgi:hypothetical protein